jgi:prepilin-type N-terminal cleavage/methylation domain-containing protein
MRFRDDKGLSLTELLVVSALMGMVLGVVYLGMQFADRASTVAETQAQFSRDVTWPLNYMDSAFSQRIPRAGVAYDAYGATVRMPSDFRPGTIVEYTFAATTDGRLTQQVHTVSGATRFLESTSVLSKTNSNRAAAKPLFRYFRNGSVTTTMSVADYVEIEIVSRADGQEYSGSRRVFFRNR